MILEKEYSYRRDDGRISNATHRFYDRNGKYVNRNTRQGCDLDITRDYNYARVPQIPSRRCKSVERRYEERLEYEELEKRMWITDKRQDPHEWRDVITQQRQAAPGRPAEAQKMHDANSYLGELPAIINRKFEESCKLEKEQRQTSEHGYCDTMEDRLRDVRNHEKSSNYGRIGKSYMPEYRSRLYDSSRYENHREIRNNRGTVTADPSLTSEYRLREQNPPSTDYVKRDTNVKFRDGMRHDTFTNNDQVVAVSGKHRCAHCADELGELTNVSPLRNKMFFM
ncbi:hypothetical protein DICVIV_10137 [Dictyocaulus viviparus]|uniref:Uncharacterized protein n=1 Tax=Dictyocaulus viviparus TaxID=29172 RepID=A0A0D8XNA4_DICVI|nr:hypothetical protein DICVIV_10137 [Dictyocaulus viviparus]